LERAAFDFLPNAPSTTPTLYPKAFSNACVSKLNLFSAEYEGSTDINNIKNDKMRLYIKAPYLKKAYFLTSFAQPPPLSATMAR
jgi:hypothetical protein